MQTCKLLEPYACEYNVGLQLPAESQKDTFLFLFLEVFFICFPWML